MIYTFLDSFGSIKVTHMMTLFLALLFNSQFTGWELLSTVQIENGFDEFMGSQVDKPVFSEQLKLHEGKELTLEGFIIPLKEGAGEQAYFILSRFPYQSCFFCGAAGPETVVEVFANRKVRYTEDRIKVTGTLRLNRNNPMQLFYILDDCEVYEL